MRSSVVRSTFAVLCCLAALSALVLRGDELPAVDDALTAPLPKFVAPPASEKPFGLRERVQLTTSRVIGSPEPPPPYVVERAFPKLKFEEPVFMRPEPGTNRIFVLELKGKLVTFPDDQNAEKAEELVDFAKADESVSFETLAFTFHPKYLENGLLYLFCTVRNKIDKEKEKEMKDEEKKAAFNERNRIYSFKMTADEPRKPDFSTGVIYLEWASSGHAGGDLAFGPDGFLYLTSGDGTTGSDPDMTGQDISDLQASILRIDVDKPDGERPYSIPPDNPFIDHEGARPEIWSFGHRAPWRFTFDQKTGDLWLGEVGQDLWEMIHLIQRGGNYGWSVSEGSHPFGLSRTLGPGPVIKPIIEHPHSEARSITCGFVYYGSRFPDLVGNLVYCDYATGGIWAFRYENGEVKDHRTLGRTTFKVPSWGIDHAGEIYLIALSGEILQLAPSPPPDGSHLRFPRKLSDTGLFTNVETHEMAPGVIPYDVNAPQWADGATAVRYIAVPGLDQIGFSERNGWDFADGAVVVQSLALDMVDGDPESRKFIETRLMSKHLGEWYGYSYAWNEEGTDAELVDAEGTGELFEIETADGDIRDHAWRFPSRRECMTCHSRAANFLLGVSTPQMNREFDYGGVIDNQLRALHSIGMFKNSPGKPPAEHLAAVNPYDESKDLEARVRSYVHTNCSHCHQKDGGGNSWMELDITKKREEMNIVDVKPIHTTFDLPEARIIAPAAPDRSVMLKRVSTRESGQMPPLSTTVVDSEWTKLLHDWIAQLPPDLKAEGEPPAGAGAGE